MVALHSSYPLCFPPPSLWNWHWKCYFWVVAGHSQWTHWEELTWQRINLIINSCPQRDHCQHSKTAWQVGWFTRREHLDDTELSAAHHKRWWLIVASDDGNDNGIYHSNMLQFNNLKKIWDGFINKLKKARHTLADQQTKLKEMQQSMMRGQQSIETKVFRVLKEIGLELNSYYGWSLNRKTL